MQQKLAHSTFTLQGAGAPIGLVGVPPEIAPTPEARQPEDRVEGDLAHELRTSLAIVTLLSGNLEILYDRLNDDKRRRMIRDIRKQMQRLNALTDDVLELCNDRGPAPM